MNTLPAQISKLSKKTIAVGALALTLAGAAALSITPALGQMESGITNDQVTLTAIPPRLGEDMSIVLDPGEKQQVQVRIRSTADEPMDILTRASDFIIGEDGYTPIPVQEDVTSRWSLASWLTVVPGTQTLNPNETGAVEVLIEVPEDALPGGHYAMITHQPSDGSEQEATAVGELNSASSISQKVGTLLYVKVDGPINEEAFVRDFTFPSLTEFGPVPFSYTIENASDIHVTPRTSVEIYNMFGKKVDVIEIEPKNVFPLMSRSFNKEDGAIWNQVWGSGLYTAKLTMSYGEQGKVAIAQTKFWLLPVKLILAGLIILLTMIAVIISARRHYLHRTGGEQERIKMLEKRLRQLEGNKLDKYED